MKPTVDITFRAARPADARTLAAISRAHVENGLKWRWTPVKIARQIRDAETMVLVAASGSTIAGFAVMRFGDDQAHLYLLAVRTEFRRLGIGRSMMQWLEKSCRTAGIRQVRLEVRASNRAALKFYRKLGFRFVARLAGYYDRRESAVVMARSLIGSG